MNRESMHSLQTRSVNTLGFEGKVSWEDGGEEADKEMGAPGASYRDRKPCVHACHAAASPHTGPGLAHGQRET